ncbi:MAG: hypothetical protein M1813_009290 [Trichoglossum hirsutum]|nr:MAG: hypothetical protein M1813_009290 [Trichoglossum hirsutum]
MPRTDSSPSPPLRRREDAPRAFHLCVLVLFWALQLLWMGLHIWLLTSIMYDRSGGPTFIAELTPLYMLTIFTIVLIGFEILVYSERYYDTLFMRFSPALYLRCNVCKCIAWGLVAIIAIIIDLQTPPGVFLSLRGLPSLIAGITMAVFLFPTSYAIAVSCNTTRYAYTEYQEINTNPEEENLVPNYMDLEQNTSDGERQ